MAEDITYSQNTYAGEAYAEKIFPALVPADGLVDRNLVTLRTGIKKKKVLRTINQTVEFQNPSAAFTAQNGTITKGERYLEPVPYEVMRQITFDELRDSWEAMELKAGSLNDYVPPASEEDALIEHMNIIVGIMNEELYLKGKAGVTAGAVTFDEEYPGMIENFRDDANVVKHLMEDIGVANITSMALTAITSAAPGVVTVASTANLRTGNKVTIVDADNNQQVNGESINGKDFTITVLSATTFSLGATITGTPATEGTVVFVNETNVLEVLNFVFNNIMDEIRNKPDLKIIISENIARAYRIASGNTSNTMNGGFLFKVAEDKQMTLEPLHYLHANTIAAYAQSNVHLGLDAESDEVNLRITDMSKTTSDDFYRYKLRMKTCINHVYGAEVLLITPVIASTES